ncbi:hypothetical protein AAMO2058_000789300 [Amorphochlora amoebiformis]
MIRLVHNLRVGFNPTSPAHLFNSNQLPSNLREVLERAVTLAEFMTEAFLLMLSKSGKLEPTFSFTGISLLLHQMRKLESNVTVRPMERRP